MGSCVSSTAPPGFEKAVSVPLAALRLHDSGKKGEGALGRGAIRALAARHLSDEYRIGKKMAHGAFGTVYMLHHLHLQDKRAMKVVTKSKLSCLEEFQMEAALMNVLDHPNILKVYDLFEDEDSFFLVMELSTGGEVFHKFAYDCFNEAEAAAIIQQVLSSIAYLHDRGVCHRDLKLENLLYDTKDSRAAIKVIDFGSASVFSKTKKKAAAEPHQKEREAAMDQIRKQAVDGGEVRLRGIPISPPKALMSDIVGTTFYMAPEIFTERYDEMVDEWAAGVILFMLLAGIPPYLGEDEAETEKKIISGDRWRFHPESVWSQISIEAKDLVRRLLQRNPAHRMKASEALTHPWLVKQGLCVPRNRRGSFESEAAAKPAVRDCLQNLRTYSADLKIQQLMLFVLSHQLTPKSTSRFIQSVFQEFDQTGRGRVDWTDFSAVVKRECSEVAEEEIKRMFETMDLDRDGFLTLAEFQNAAVDRGKLLDPKMILVAFAMLDADRDGVIGPADLERCLYPSGNATSKADMISSAIDEADTNKDGSLDLFEVFEALRPLVPEAYASSYKLSAPHHNKSGRTRRPSNANSSVAFSRSGTAQGQSLSPTSPAPPMQTSRRPSTAASVANSTQGTTAPISQHEAIERAWDVAASLHPELVDVCASPRRRGSHAGRQDAKSSSHGRTRRGSDVSSVAATGTGPAAPPPTAGAPAGAPADGIQTAISAASAVPAESSPSRSPSPAVPQDSVVTPRAGPFKLPATINHLDKSHVSKSQAKDRQPSKPERDEEAKGGDSGKAKQQKSQSAGKGEKAERQYSSGSIPSEAVISREASPLSPLDPPVGKSVSFGANDTTSPSPGTLRETPVQDDKDDDGQPPLGDLTLRGRNRDSELKTRKQGRGRTFGGTSQFFPKITATLASTAEKREKRAVQTAGGDRRT
uniref:non-specific serine/threonine protein kinase n=1 Tax=Chromera velia CCMP2878 TaxID=1169474 RepID=A0A0G4IDP9_9ALVE|eukprot:Cvel_13508.t1-p1 / transcript=Cvel_13508.t1 / gene=Cvel_13508 / organism=Chromera_velia_CCMP2878 / gene_product=Calcium-dependent protein kinase 3, putative / transcript_product=Calcium-dependent protein kinase 3, putative / location=Cvel_scaffold926:16392-24626(+) / protein_length=923 / sequence_SO=supercontig / SO=protein_coding / is_pseudo=false